MITVKVTLQNGRNWVTGINATGAEARAYYLGKMWESSSDPEREDFSKCVRVEVVSF